MNYFIKIDREIESQGLSLLPNEPMPWSIETRNKISVAILAASRDYFTPAYFYLQVRGEFPKNLKTAYLLVEYFDDGFGLIQLAFDSHQPESPSQPHFDPRFTPASEQIGSARLNTQTLRKALFKLEVPAFQHRQKSGADLRLSGVTQLHAVHLLNEVRAQLREEILQQIPQQIDPPFKLKRPLQLVTTAGTDSQKKEDLAIALARMQDLLPLAKALGFNGIESYVKWNFVEPEPTHFDWSYYDSVIAQLKKYNLKWFPLLIVGSAYTLPDWYYHSAENVGFVCLEHGERNDIQSIFCPNQIPHVKRFLQAFGAHYDGKSELLGVRLGPSGNYGESQYPASGNWGYGWQPHHCHLGYWAADAYAGPAFQQFLKERYQEKIEQLNQNWATKFSSFGEIETFHPAHARTQQMRVDFQDWYVGAMTDWCENWAIWAREAMPRTDIDQSVGGWGFMEAGTDFTLQTRSMLKMNGGVRVTNEDDSFALNFFLTRLIASAARFYKVKIGYEPAGFGSVRGVMARLFNTITTNGEHLFYYHPNLLDNDQAIDAWIKHAPLLDERDEPLIEVAALYPDTMIKVNDDVLRYLYAGAFPQRVAALRPLLDFDFCSEPMIQDGALAQYKVLLFLWGNVVEEKILNQIDAWVRSGGIVIYPFRAATPLGTVADDFSVYKRWLRGDTGNGKVIIYRSDFEPPHRYAQFIKNQLLTLRSKLHPLTIEMLRLRRPDEVYISVLKNGKMVILNFNDAPVRVEISDENFAGIEPYSIFCV
jgi:hypothetical protein